MRIRELSLRAKITLGGTLIVLIPLIIVGTVTFVNSFLALEDISRVQNIQIARSMSGIIRTAIEKDLNILSAMANDPFIINGASRNDYSGMNEKLADLYKKAGMDYEGLAVFDQKGFIRADGVDIKRIGISISDRYYFQKTRAGQKGISSVVASKATGDPIFALHVPIMSKEGRFSGGVLGIVKADYLLRYILSLKLGKTGYAFMIDNKGITVAHPDPQYIMQFDTTMEDESVREFARRMIRQETGAAEYIFRGKKKVLGFAPIESTGWSIGVTQDKDEVMALAYANRNLILMVSGLFLLLTILAVFFFSRSISAPVQKTLTTLNQAIEQATDAIMIIGLNRRIQFANPAMAAIIDRPVQDLIGAYPSLDNTNLTNIDEIWDLLEQGNTWSGLIKGVKKNSRSYSMNMTITPVRDETGRISSFLAIGRDISRELIMEQQLRQSQKMEAIGTLAGGIAHDFNNILSAIFGFSEILLRNMSDMTKTRLYLSEILKAAERARELVNHIMTFSRQTDQEKQAFMPRHIIKEALKMLRASLPSTIELKGIIKSNAMIMADPTQIHQVLMNLCTNAGYALKEQGGIIEVTLDDIDLDDEFARHHEGIKPGRHIILKVSDTGSGIPPEIIDRIFDPFFTTKALDEGTGLGLSVVHGIVKSLDGIISVSSNPEQGTTFTIYLPAGGKELQDSESDAQEDAPCGSGSLMLVDDEEAIVRSGKTLLEDLGYKVTGFTKSDTALDRFCKEPRAFDAVITDYTMPQMTGYELAGRIREFRQDIPIILCSGYIDEEVEKRIRNAGINALLKKPLTRRDLAVALKRILNKKEGKDSPAEAGSR